MIRKKKEKTYPIVETCKPFFWKKCRFCDLEFRIESGFKILDLKQCFPSGTDPREVTYCCSKCASSESEVIDIIGSRKITNILKGKLRLNKLDKLKNWLKGEKYILEQVPDKMTEQYEKEHAWELSRNRMIDKTIYMIDEFNMDLTN